MITVARTDLTRLRDVLLLAETRLFLAKCLQHCVFPGGHPSKY